MKNGVDPNRNTHYVINSAKEGETLEKLLENSSPLKPVSVLIMSKLGDMALDKLAVEVGISHAAIYKIRNGKIRPKRDVLLAMAFVLNMTIEETQQFLKSGRRSKLTASDPRDVTIIYGLYRGMSLDKMDSLLEEKQFTPLLPQKEACLPPVDNLKK